MEFDCGVCRPTGERYTNGTFRRYAPRLAAGLTLPELGQLRAFLDVVPPRHARWVFHWGKAMRYVHEIMEDNFITQAAQPYIHANLRSLTEEDGWWVMQAMKDGGWRGHGFPKIVHQAIKVGAHRGETIKSQAERWGLSEVQIEAARRGARRAETAQRISSIGSLTV